jgi:hypothetical protein
MGEIIWQEGHSGLAVSTYTPASPEADTLRHG